MHAYNTTRGKEWLNLKILVSLGLDVEMEQTELSYITGGNIKWSNHFGKPVVS